MANRSIPRLAATRLAALAEAAPLIAVTGARAVGKSTTARSLAASVFAADEPATRAALQTDPDGVLAGAARPSLVDEWQLAPEVLGAVKRAVDKDAKPGQFLLTGSADPRTGMHAAAGRVIRMPMHPLTQLEINARDDADLRERVSVLPVMSLIVGEAPDLAAMPESSRHDVVQRIVTSGFPALVRSSMDDRLRADWLDSYLAASLALDPDAGAIDNRRLRRYLDAVRATSGMVVTDQSLREAADIATNTARGYLDLLERIHLVIPVPAWDGAVLGQLLKAPKRVIVDAALSGVSRERMLSDDARFGAILETFVHAQLAPLGALGPRPFEVFHLRTAGGQHEIDFLLQTPDGNVVAVEVKAAAGAGVADARHLVWFRDRLGSRFLGGVVLHLGSVAGIVSERIWVMPVSSLW